MRARVSSPCAVHTECEEGVMPVGMLIGMWWTADEDGDEDAMPVRMISPYTLDGWMAVSQGPV